MRRHAALFVMLLTAALLSGLPARAQELSSRPLTESQKKAMLSTLNGTKNRILPLAKQLFTMQAEINGMMLADRPDEAAIRKHKSRISALVGRLIEMRIDDIRKMLKVLTPEQKKEVAAEAAKPDGEKDLFNVIVRRFGLPERPPLS